MPKNNPAAYFQGGQGGQGKMVPPNVPGQPDAQALMQQQMPPIMAGVGQPGGGVPQGMDPMNQQAAMQRMQAMQAMQGAGAAGQEFNPVTQMPQIRGRVAPGMGMPQQFQAPQGRIDPRAFAMQLAQQRAAQQGMRRPGGGIAEYQANQAAKVAAIKAAMEKKVADAKAAKLRAKQNLLMQGMGQVSQPFGGGDGGASGDGGGGGDGGAGSAGAGE